MEDGVKCFICGADVPVFGNVLWCDDCINECLDGPEKMDEFITRKKAQKMPTFDEWLDQQPFGKRSLPDGERLVSDTIVAMMRKAWDARVSSSFVIIPNPAKGAVALVIGDGKFFSTAQVKEFDLANNPAGTVSLVMRVLERALLRAQKDGQQGWTEVDVRQTATGYELSDAAVEEVMRASFGDEP